MEIEICIILIKSINLPKNKMNLHHIESYKSYRTVNVFHIYCKMQSDRADYWNRGSLWGPCKTQMRPVGWM